MGVGREVPKGGDIVYIELTHVVVQQKLTQYYKAIILHNGNPLQYSCLENSMDRGYSPWDCERSQPMEWEKISANGMTEKGLIFNKY